MHKNRFSTRFRSAALLATLLSSSALAQDSAAKTDQMQPDSDQFMAADLHADIRSSELLSRGADFTAVRLNQEGEAITRMDLHFGGELPTSERELMDLLNPFQFGEAEGRDKDEDSSWRTLIVPNPQPASGEADLIHFDPDEDLVIEIRRLVLDTSISCYSSWAVNYNGHRSTGSNLYWYSNSDAINATTGPNRSTSTDPDLYLYYRSGSSWRLLNHSAYGGWIDSVGGHNSSCNTVQWRVRVYMYRGGNFGVRSLSFRAW